MFCNGDGCPHCPAAGHRSAEHRWRRGRDGRRNRCGPNTRPAARCMRAPGERLLPATPSYSFPSLAVEGRLRRGHRTNHHRERRRKAAYERHGPRLPALQRPAVSTAAGIGPPSYKIIAAFSKKARDQPTRQRLRMKGWNGRASIKSNAAPSGSRRPPAASSRRFPLRRRLLAHVLLDERDDVIAERTPVPPRPGFCLLEQVFGTTKCGVPGHLSNSIPLLVRSPAVRRMGGIGRS